MPVIGIEEYHLSQMYKNHLNVWKDSHHKHKSRNTNNDVSNRTRSKADYTDKHIGSRTRSKLHNINVNNLSVQNLFFPLHDAILFQGHGKSQEQDSQLGIMEFKVYNNALIHTCSLLKGQSQFMIYFRLFLGLDLVCKTGM
jgi:hypothetical protein